MTTARPCLAALLFVTASALAEPTTAPADRTPTQIADAFNQAVIAGDKAAALALTRTPDDAATKQVDRLVGNAANGKAVPHTEAESVDQELAVARLRVDRPGNPPRLQFLPMVHTDEGWRVLTNMKSTLAPEQMKRLDALRKALTPADTAAATQPAAPATP